VHSGTCVLLGDGCRNCGELGHFARECTKEPADGRCKCLTYRAVSGVNLAEFCTVWSRLPVVMVILYELFADDVSRDGPVFISA